MFVTIYNYNEPLKNVRNKGTRNESSVTLTDKVGVSLSKW